MLRYPVAIVGLLLSVAILFVEIDLDQITPSPKNETAVAVLSSTSHIYANIFDDLANRYDAIGDKGVDSELADKLPAAALAASEPITNVLQDAKEKGKVKETLSILASAFRELKDNE